MNFERIKRALGLPDKEEYPLDCNDTDVVLPEHDSSNPNCSCPECIERFMQECSDRIMNGD